MFDQASRSLWLEDQLWPKLREAFPLIRSLPAEALLTVGYPASGARGRSEKIKPAEVNMQWTGNANERVFISVHPVYFTSPVEIAKAILFSAGKHVGGARWGAYHIGVSKDDSGTLTASPDTQSKIDAILADIGEPPAGYGIAFPVRSVQRARLRRYVADHDPCSVTGKDHPVHRVASDNDAFQCSRCNTPYSLT